MYATTTSYFPNTLIDHTDLFHRIFCTVRFCNIINITFILQGDNVHKLSISMSNGNKVKQIFSFTARARHMYACFIYSNALRLHNKYKQAVIITIFIPSPSSLFASHYFVRHVLLSFTNNWWKRSRSGYKLVGTAHLIWTTAALVLMHLHHRLYR